MLSGNSLAQNCGLAILRKAELVLVHLILFQLQNPYGMHLNGCVEIFVVELQQREGNI